MVPVVAPSTSMPPSSPFPIRTPSKEPKILSGQRQLRWERFGRLAGGHFPHSNLPRFYQVHLGAKDVEIAAARARILPFATLAAIIGV